MIVATGLRAQSAQPPIRYSELKQEVIAARIERYKGNNRERGEALKRLFADSGCDEQHLSTQPIKGSKAPNIVCVLPGTGERSIIVGAHFDRVDAGDGVIDNWSGASLLPSLFASLTGEPRRHTFVFIGFTDEEKGLLGSEFYVKAMTKEQVDTTDAMVNMDTLGLAPTEIWATHADPLLMRALYAIARRLDVPLSAMNVDNIGSSDSESFAARNIRSLTVHSLTQAAWNARILHTSKDRRAELKIDDYYQSYRLVAAYLAYLDQLLPMPSPALPPSPTLKGKN